MSEATEPLQSPSPWISVAQLRFTPDAELHQLLRAMYKPDQNEESQSLQRLFLYSDESIQSQRTSPSSLMYGAKSQTAAQLAKVQRDLKTRVDKPHFLAKRMQMERIENKHPGTLLRLDVVLDELTAAAIRGVLTIQPDLSVRSHHFIDRHHITGRDEFLRACRSLYERLADEQAAPLTVRKTELLQNPVKR